MGEVIKLPNARIVEPRPDPVVRDAIERVHLLYELYLRPEAPVDADMILKGIMDIMEEEDLCRAAGLERPKAG